MSDELTRNIERLNKEQRAAVEAIDGPVLVIAGPGTGKTQVLALRIANILQKTDAAPANILCLTFTESGVTAMRQRLARMIGKEAYYVKIHTFHSFCNEIIQSFPEKFAFARDLLQLDDLSRLKVIRDVIERLDSGQKMHLRPLHDKFYYQNEILMALQTLKREGVTVEHFEEIVTEKLSMLNANPELNKRTGKPKSDWTTKLKSMQRNSELAQIYKLYNTELLEQGFYDYEDMILFVIKKLGEDDELLAYYQEKFLYILVDEYQDTNGSQNELLKILASFDSSPNVFAVGDDDQAIYRFQGANVENLLFFTQQFKDVTTIPIVKNYRSSQLILDLAESAIEQNKARLVNIIPKLSKKLKSGLQLKDHKAQVYSFSDDQTENKFIVSKITELVKNGVPYSDIAVFYRKHADAEDIVDALLRADVPIKLAAGRNSLDEVIVQQFINLLKVINYTDQDRDFLLFQVLFYNYLKFKRLDIFKLTKLSADKKISLFSIMSEQDQLNEAKLEDAMSIKAFSKQLVDWKAEAANMSLVQFIEKVAQESGYINYIFKVNTDIENANSVASFFAYVRTSVKQNRKLTLEELLADLELLERNRIQIEERELDTEKNGVNLMTAHKAKGLEFKYVFIVKFYDGNWGGRRKREVIKLPLEELSILQETSLNVPIDYESEDERRLFYVALTRAKEQVYITYAKKYPSGNTTKEVSPSQFLFELDRNKIEVTTEADEEKEDLTYLEQSLTPAKLTSPYSIDEEKFLREVVLTFKLSPTALNEYIECPLKFKFSKLFGIPRPIEKTMILGSALHHVFENYFRTLKNNERKDLKYMLFIFEKYLERSLLGGTDLEQTLAEGKFLLTNYYKEYNGSFSAPAEVEYSFSGRDLFLESEQTEPIPITGIIDKLEWLDKKENIVRVIDYKVTTPKSANEIKGLTKNADASIYRQLMFYKVLADSDPLFKPTLSSTKRYTIADFAIDFVKPNARGAFKKEVFTITDQELRDFKVLVGDVMARIRNLEFSGSLEYPLCGECEYCRIIK